MSYDITHREDRMDDLLMRKLLVPAVAGAFMDETNLANSKELYRIYAGLLGLKLTEKSILFKLSDIRFDYLFNRTFDRALDEPRKRLRVAEAFERLGALHREGVEIDKIEPANLTEAAILRALKAMSDSEQATVLQGVAEMDKAQVRRAIIRAQQAHRLTGEEKKLFRNAFLEGAEACYVRRREMEPEAIPLMRKVLIHAIGGLLLDRRPHAFNDRAFTSKLRLLERLSNLFFSDPSLYRLAIHRETVSRISKACQRFGALYRDGKALDGFKPEDQTQARMLDALKEMSHDEQLVVLRAFAGMSEEHSNWVLLYFFGRDRLEPNEIKEIWDTVREGAAARMEERRKILAKHSGNPSLRINTEEEKKHDTSATAELPAQATRSAGSGKGQGFSM